MLSDNGANSDKSGLHGNSTPINIPASQAITKILVEIMSNPAKVEIPSLAVAQTLLDLCDEFDMSIAKHTVLCKLHRFAGDHNAQIFCIASQSDHLDLARQALSLMELDVFQQNVDIDSISRFCAPDFVRNCEPSYLGGLLKMIIKCPQANIFKQESHSFCITSSEWQRAAQDFVPAHQHWSMDNLQ